MMREEKIVDQVAPRNLPFKPKGQGGLSLSEASTMDNMDDFERASVKLYGRTKVHPLAIISVENELTIDRQSLQAPSVPEDESSMEVPNIVPLSPDPSLSRPNPLFVVSNELMQVSGYQPKFPVPEINNVSRPDSGAHSMTSGQQTNRNRPTSSIPLVPEGNDKNKEKPGKNKEKPSKQPSVHQIRQRLFKSKILVSDWALVFAMLGIILTVVEAELIHRDVIQRDDVTSTVLLSLVVTTTIVLLFLITAFYYIDFRLTVLNSGTGDWRYAVTRKRVAQYILEMIICAICPVPYDIDIPWIDAGNDFAAGKGAHAPLNVLLTVPMFLRFYLVCRYFTHHSRHYQDTATRSIASLNHIPVNFRFVTKTYLHDNPTKLLLPFLIGFTIVMAWLWMHCEKVAANANADFLTAVWFIIITFLSIGYGDVTATTYCGRTMAVITGIVGGVMLSAVVAVVSRSVALSRPEQHVNHFLSDNRLTRERSNLAAAIIQHAWFTKKYSKYPKTDRPARSKYAYHNRKLVECIARFRRVVWETRKTVEDNDCLIDVIDMQTDMHRSLNFLQKSQDRISAQIETLLLDIQEIKQKKHRHKSSELPSIQATQPNV